jgi:hypothetical protein
MQQNCFTPNYNKYILSLITTPEHKYYAMFGRKWRCIFQFYKFARFGCHKKSYKFCLLKFLIDCKIDLAFFLKLPQQDISNLIIKYLVEKNISREYKNLIVSTIKHACEINDIILNCKKIKKFIKSEKNE